jgi:hypothetical protein
VLAAIDALGGAGPEAKGAAGPPLPQLPPGYVMIKRPDGTIIYGPTGTSWKPDGTMTVPGVPEQPKTETIEHATWEFCHRYVFKIPAGRELVIQVVTGTPDMYLIVTETGKDPESISPPDSRRYLGPTTVEFHPVGKRGGSVDVVIGIQ